MTECRVLLFLPLGCSKDITCVVCLQLVPPVGMLNNPMNAVTTKFVRTSTNKVKCPVFVVRVRDYLDISYSWSGSFCNFLNFTI